MMYLLRQKNVDMAERSHVMAVAAQFLRRILVDHARRRNAEKRGGENREKESLHISAVGDAKKNSATQMDLLELNDALDLLEQQSPRSVEVVVMKFFGGMTGDEIAAHLGVSLRTVNTDWRFAKAWLYKRLSDS